MKKCAKCGKEKPLDEFHRHSRARGSGRHPQCKECRQAGRRKPPKQLGLVLEKRCARCHEVKPIQDFYLRRDRPGQVTAYCKDCGSDVGNEWRKDNPERARANGRRQQLKLKHNLTLEQYEAMLAAQGGGCAICGTTVPLGNGRFPVDHDHACCPGERSCGKCVRGLLCNHCNPLLGHAKDDPDILRRAIEYLEKWKGVVHDDQQTA